MSVLSGESIRKAVASGLIGIDPFDPEGIQPASYDSRLHWDILVSPTRKERGKGIDLREEPNKRYAVEPGRFVGILSLELLTMPLNMAGRFGMRAYFSRHGLVAFSGIQIDPGWHGRLTMSLFNAGPEPIDLVEGERIFTLEFHTLDVPVIKGYEGEFQNQLTFPDIQKYFILNAQTVSLSEIHHLPDQVASVNFRLADIESRMAEPKTLSDVAKRQGVSPIPDLARLPEAWPEEEDINDFRAAVRRWRGKG